MGYLGYKSDDSDNKLNDDKWIQCVFYCFEQIATFFTEKSF